MAKKKELIITEVNGTECPHEWLARRVKEFAKDKYGRDLRVEINPKYISENK